MKARARAGIYYVGRSGAERAFRAVAVVLFLQRLSYLVPTAADTALGVTTYRSAALNVLMVVAAVGWNAVLAGVVVRHGWFPRWAIGTDVAVVCALLAAGTLNCRPEEVFYHLNWPISLSLATGALLGAALGPRWTVVVLLAPITTHIGVVALRLGAEALTFQGVLGVVDSYFWWVLAAYIVRRYLSGQGRALDEATRRELELQARRAAEKARYAERIEQYRKLHDNVLATLTAIARGGLDHRTEAVRARCAAEADYVRRLIHEDSAGGRTPLGTRLGEVIGEVEQLGLRVRYLQDRLPAELSARVVDGIAEASREALNNVLAHSGTREAWLTATWDDGRLLVRIADRGRGFHPGTAVSGFGVRSSIMARMRELGGMATVTGMPGDGVYVDLVWPSGRVQV